MMKLLDVFGFNNLDYEKLTYLRIALFAMLLHILYIVIFAVLSMSLLSIYNIFSSLFYLTIALVILYKRKYKLAIVSIHVEVAVFAAIFTAYNGMRMGVGMYLLSMASTVYFNPFSHKCIPYILAVCDMFIYVILRVITNIFIINGLVQLSLAPSTFLHLFNACGSFLIIILAAYFTDTSFIHDKAQLEEANEALAEIANYDNLTGLQSRHFFTERAEQFDPLSYTAVAIGDIDDFKQINDTYGHLCGDYVLQKTAELMRKTLDPEKVDICRWGGEEFVFLFHEHSFNDAYNSLEKLRKRVENYDFHHNGTQFKLTMTFGLISTLNKKFTPKMLETADKLLYRGKHQGKNLTIK